MIYCHHHSKGAQGDKKAQDRASGSGVFARDPDALLDMIELEVDGKRRKAVADRLVCDRLAAALDAKSAVWRQVVGQDDALKASSEGWHENENDYGPFMLYLLQILYACYKELDLRYANESTKRMPKAKQVEALLMSTYAPISKAEVCERLPEISATTVERALGNLVKAGIIEKMGKYRDARYRKVSQ